VISDVPTDGEHDEAGEGTDRVHQADLGRISAQGQDVEGCIGHDHTAGRVARQVGQRKDQVVAPDEPQRVVQRPVLRHMAIVLALGIWGKG
jgi:hypothetical protein